MSNGVDHSGSAQDQINIGEEQLKRSRNNIAEAPFFMKMSTQERLELGKEGSKNVIEGRMRLNKQRKFDKEE
jgi:hypothetical protein